MEIAIRFLSSGKITTPAGTCGRGVERETKDLLLSAVRNDSFLKRLTIKKSFVRLYRRQHFKLIFF